MQIPLLKSVFRSCLLRSLASLSYTRTETTWKEEEPLTRENGFFTTHPAPLVSEEDAR